MYIFIDNYTVHINVENESFVLTDETKQVRKISPYKLSGILIYKPCTITTAALILAAQNNIAIIMHDNYHKPVARIMSNINGNHVNIRRQQALFSFDTQSIAYMHQTMLLKYKGQESNLAYCHNRLPGNKVVLKWKQKLESLVTTQLNTQPVTLQQIRVAEAHISRCYWYVLSLAMKNYLPFARRSMQPAQDGFNALINYGYGMLYAMVETALLAAGLDPQIGFMHAQKYATPSLVFDMIEPFRAWIDDVVLELCFTKTITTAHFEEWNTGIGLTGAGKAIMIPAVIEKMNTPTLFQGKKIKRKDQIQFYATALAKYLLNEYQYHA